MEETYQIKLDGEVLISGDPKSIIVIFNNLNGANFTPERRAPGSIGTHEDYLACMAQEWCVAAWNGTLMLHSENGAALAKHDFQTSAIKSIEQVPVANAHMRCDMLNVELSKRYPAAGLSFGYIGNVNGNNDDRSWRFFTHIPDKNDPRGVMRHAFGGEGTEGMQKLAERAERYLERWLRERMGLPDLGDKVPASKLRDIRDIAEQAEALGFASVDEMNKHQARLDGEKDRHAKVMSYQQTGEARRRVAAASEALGIPVASFVHVEPLEIDGDNEEHCSSCRP